MVFKNSNPKSSPTKILPKNERPIDVSVGPDRTTQFICHTELQVEYLNKAFTEKGNIPINYECTTIEDKGALENKENSDNEYEKE